MRFRAQITDLNEALGLVSVVTPRPIPNQGAGYLMVVSGTTCSVYSHDGARKAKTSFEVSDVDGDGSFVLPVEKVSALKYLDGYADFKAGKSDDRFFVEYESEAGAKQEFSTFDPMAIKPFDEELAAPSNGEGDVFPAAILREALNLVKPFFSPLADSRVSDEAFKTIRLFDGRTDDTKKGNGVMYAADKVRAGYFSCEALKDMSLSVHGQHLPVLLSFLAKCEGNVTILACASSTFVRNSKGQVFGWPHQTKQHEKFSYYGLKMDQFILRMPKDLLVKALRYVRNGIDPRKDKIRVQYSYENKTLQIVASEEASRIESPPVGVLPVEESETGAGSLGNKEDFAANLNLNQFLELVEPMKGHEVTLRVANVPLNGETQTLLRTIEEFHLNEQGRVVIPSPEGEKAYPCKVTRYMPSRK